MSDEDPVEVYLNAAEDAPPAVSAARVMPELGERMKSADGIGDKMEEIIVAGDAIAQLTADGIYFDHYHFFKKLSVATGQRLVTNQGSKKAEDHPDSAAESARNFLGPTDRPWSRKSDRWTQSISSLVEEQSHTETVFGPRTEAGENIRARIGSATAYRSLYDVEAQELIYVDAEIEEIWIPTSMVADAVESVETSHRALQSGLAKREHCRSVTRVTNANREFFSLNAPPQSSTHNRGRTRNSHFSHLGRPISQCEQDRSTGGRVATRPPASHQTGGSGGGWTILLPPVWWEACSRRGLYV